MEFKKDNHLDKDKIHNLILDCRNEYLEKISNYDLSFKIFTDKAPLNFRFIGFIKYLFSKCKNNNKL